MPLCGQPVTEDEDGHDLRRKMVEVNARHQGHRVALAHSGPCLGCLSTSSSCRFGPGYALSSLYSARRTLLFLPFRPLYPRLRALQLASEVLSTLAEERETGRPL
jgi:hypothetical protein